MVIEKKQRIPKKKKIITKYKITIAIKKTFQVQVEALSHIVKFF